MTTVYLGYPPENVKAWILAHSAPALPKDPSEGGGHWEDENGGRYSWDESNQYWVRDGSGGGEILRWNNGWEIYVVAEDYAAGDDSGVLHTGTDIPEIMGYHLVWSPED